MKAGEPEQSKCGRWGEGRARCTLAPSPPTPLPQGERGAKRSAGARRSSGQAIRQTRTAPHEPLSPCGRGVGERGRPCRERATSPTPLTFASLGLTGPQAPTGSLKAARLASQGERGAKHSAGARRASGQAIRQTRTAPHLSPSPLVGEGLGRGGDLAASLPPLPRPLSHRGRGRTAAARRKSGQAIRLQPVGSDRLTDCDEALTLRARTGGAAAHRCTYVLQRERRLQARRRRHATRPAPQR